MTRGFSSSSDNWKHIFGKEVLFEERDSATFGNVRTDCRHSVTPFDYFPSPLLQISSSFASKENSRVIKSEGFFFSVKLLLLPPQRSQRSLDFAASAYHYTILPAGARQPVHKCANHRLILGQRIMIISVSLALVLSKLFSFSRVH